MLDGFAIRHASREIYSLDTSAILDGRIRYYPVDVFPALWSNFEKLAESGNIKASEVVRHELERQKV